MTDGWNESAEAWIKSMGADGDFSRQHVLDTPMMARVKACKPNDVLDLGCGEGRFSRMMAPYVETVIGIDPTQALLDQANALGHAQYVQTGAENLPFENASFDLAVSYLSLIDIPDVPAAIAETARVLRPGGAFLIANLNSWATASQGKNGGWRHLPDGGTQMTMGRYLEPHSDWAEWDGIRIHNWHRPQAFYIQHLIEAGFTLTYFAEPKATGGARAETYNHTPYLHLMEWRKAHTK